MFCPAHETSSPPRPPPQNGPGPAGQGHGARPLAPRGRSGRPAAGREPAGRRYRGGHTAPGRLEHGEGRYQGRAARACPAAGRRRGRAPCLAEAEADTGRRRKRPPSLTCPEWEGCQEGARGRGGRSRSRRPSPAAPHSKPGAHRRRHLPRRHLGLLSPGRRARPFRPRLFPSRRQPLLPTVGPTVAGPTVTEAAAGRDAATWPPCGDSARQAAPAAPPLASALARPPSLPQPTPTLVKAAWPPAGL